MYYYGNPPALFTWFMNAPTHAWREWDLKILSNKFLNPFHILYISNDYIHIFLGFRQLDPFEGCEAVADTALTGVEEGFDEGTDVLDLSSTKSTTQKPTTTRRTTTTTRRTTTTTRRPTTTRRTTTSSPDRPYVYPTRPSLIGFDEEVKSHIE